MRGPIRFVRRRGGNSFDERVSPRRSTSFPTTINEFPDDVRGGPRCRYEGTCRRYAELVVVGEFLVLGELLVLREFLVVWELLVVGHLIVVGDLGGPR